MYLNPKAFSIVNTKATGSQKAVIYTTTDTSWNIMTFTFNNYTTADLALNGGTPAYPVQPKGPTSLVIDFSSILTDDQVAVLVITDANKEWDYQFFKSTVQGTPSVWVLTPKNSGTLAAGASVVFTITNLACTSQTPNNFDVSYYNIDGYNDMPFPFSYHIAVLAPPVGNLLPIDYGYMDVIHPIGTQTTFTPDAFEKDGGLGGPNTPVEVDITYDNNYPIKNGFTIYLKNTSPDPLEPHGTSLGNASITVSFLFSKNSSPQPVDDVDAITSQALGDGISININPEKSLWTTKQHIPNTPNWVFTPQSSEVMFGYETVKLEVTNIITELLITPSTLSTVYIQFNSIPGYQDCVYTIQMEKITAVASIPNGITANPNTISYGQNVGLTWNTEVAYKVTLDYTDRDGNPHHFDSTQGQIGLDASGFQPNPAPSAEKTVFILTAYDNNGSTSASAPVQVNEPPAVITSFTASSYLVNILSSGNQTTISWTVTGAQTVTLQGQPVGLTGTQQFTINNTTVFTLVAKPYGTVQPTVTQAFTVFAFKAYAPIPTGAGGDGTVWQSLPLTLLNSTNNRIYATNAANGGNIFQVSQPLKALASPTFTGNIMALSPDQTILCIAQVNSGAPSGVTAYNTTSGAPIAAGQPFPGPPPYCMAISPDQKYLIAAQQNNCTAVSIFNLNGGAISYNQDVTVGNSPRNVAFIGTKAYIPNYRSGTVSVIDLTNIQGQPGTITLNQGEPRAVAVVGTKLYVACEQYNIVVAIETANGANTVTPITTDWRPFQLVLNQNQTLLFVCNFASNTVSVIDTATNTVKQTLKVGNSPSAAKVSNSGKLLFVSNYCDNTLSVADLTQNPIQVVGSLPLDANSGNPVDISTYNANNYYTDLFIAKENFKNRTSCANPLPNPTNLQMSVLSIQELGGGYSEEAVSEEQAGAIQQSI